MVLSRMSHVGHGVWEYGNTVIAFSGLTGGTGTGVRGRGNRTGVRHCLLTGGKGTGVRGRHGVNLYHQVQ